MTKGDIKWIKKHTEKTMKGLYMKQTKKNQLKGQIIQ